MDGEDDPEKRSVTFNLERKRTAAVRDRGGSPRKQGQKGELRGEKRERERKNE